MARYANDTLCHVWASGRVPEARSNHGSMFFEGPVLYSYGRHYAIAVRMPGNVVLFNASGSSVTTAKQSGYAWRAALHMVRHNVPDLTNIANALAAYETGKREEWQSAAIAASVWSYIRALDGKRHWLERNAAAVERRKTLRRYVMRLRGYIDRYEALAASELRDAIQCGEFIAIRGKVPMPAMSAALNDARLRLTTLQELEAARRFEREREAREAWLNGATGYWRGNDGKGGALIRATGVERDESGTITGGTLETSQGANVPLTHAVKIFAIARACREQGRTMEPRARCGFYTVDRIDETGGFNAGCHRINWEEIERLAAMLGLYP